MWTNFLDDQDLSENLLSKAAVDLNEEDVVDRGVESYTVPEQKRKNYEKYVRVSFYSLQFFAAAFWHIFRTI